MTLCDLQAQGLPSYLEYAHPDIPLLVSDIPEAAHTPSCPSSHLKSVHPGILLLASNILEASQFRFTFRCATRYVHPDIHLLASDISEASQLRLTFCRARCPVIPSTSIPIYSSLPPILTLLLLHQLSQVCPSPHTLLCLRCLGDLSRVLTFSGALRPPLLGLVF